tara:strand:+ start:333 stop:554 length:222 start_codon:yes stop_codon:yes gene_type:complete
MAMSRKHYEAFAEAIGSAKAISNGYGTDPYEQLIMHFETIFYEDNTEYKSEKFKNAIEKWYKEVSYKIETNGD